MNTTLENDVQTMDIHQEIEIDAPPEVVFDAVLEEIGPGSETEDGTSMNMKVEPWPGGRWYRDLSGDNGHLWGHVQVIKRPTLLELSGPLFMSYPAVNFVQYRLKAEGQRTRLTIVHRAMGLIPAEHREGVSEGWAHGLKRIREIAQRMANEKAAARR
jgi:uncharacterized protein YndB with AHSA1/START domain